MQMIGRNGVDNYFRYSFFYGIAPAKALPNYTVLIQRPKGPVSLQRSCPTSQLRS